MDLSRIITLGGIGLTGLSVLLAVVFLRREHRVRLGWDALRVLTTAAGIAGAVLLLHVQPRIEFTAAAAAAGFLIGLLQGRTLTVRLVEGIALSRRTILGMLAWGAGIIATQVASYLNRADVVRYALVASAFGVGLALGALFGSARAVSVARNRSQAVPAAVTAVIALVAIVLSASPEAVAQDDEINPHAGTYEGVEPIVVPELGEIGQYSFVVVVTEDGILAAAIDISGGRTFSDGDFTVEWTVTGTGTCSGTVESDGTLSCTGSAEGVGSVVGGGASFAVPGSGPITGSGTIANGEMTGTLVGTDGSAIPFTGIRVLGTEPLITTTTTSLPTTTTVDVTTSAGVTDTTMASTTTVVAPVIVPDEGSLTADEDITEEEAAGGAAAAAAAALAALLTTLPAARPGQLRGLSTVGPPEAPGRIPDPHAPGQFLPEQNGKVWYGEWLSPEEAARRVGRFHEETQVRAQIDHQTAEWRAKQQVEFWDKRRARLLEEQARAKAERQRERDAMTAYRRSLDAVIERSGDERYDRAFQSMIEQGSNPDGSVNPESVERLRDLVGRMIRTDNRPPFQEIDYLGKTVDEIRHSTALRVVLAIPTFGGSEIYFFPMQVQDKIMQEEALHSEIDLKLSMTDRLLIAMSEFGHTYLPITQAAKNLRGEPTDAWDGVGDLLKGVSLRNGARDHIAERVADKNGFRAGERRACQDATDHHDLDELTPMKMGVDSSGRSYGNRPMDHPGKPMKVKIKSIEPDDLFLDDFTAQDLTHVPGRPPSGRLKNIETPADYARAKARLEFRRAEFEAKGGSIADGVQSGEFTIDQRGRLCDAKTGKPQVTDLEMYSITRNGVEITGDEAIRIQNSMRDRGRDLPLLGRGQGRGVGATDHGQVMETRFQQTGGELAKDLAEGGGQSSETFRPGGNAGYEHHFTYLHGDSIQQASESAFDTAEDWLLEGGQ